MCAAVYTMNSHLYLCFLNKIDHPGGSEGLRFLTNSSVLGETLGFPGNSDGKESACNVGDLGSIPGLGRSPGGGHGNPLQYSCLENPHGQRSLVDYSPWGRKE